MDYFGINSDVYFWISTLMNAFAQEIANKLQNDEEERCPAARQNVTCQTDSYNDKFASIEVRIAVPPALCSRPDTQVISICFQDST